MSTNSKTYFQKYYLLNKEKMNKRNSDQERRHSRGLTDGYIKKLLVANYGYVREKIPAGAIVAHREKVAQDRREGKSKPLST